MDRPSSPSLLDLVDAILAPVAMVLVAVIAALGLVLVSVTPFGAVADGADLAPAGPGWIWRAGYHIGWSALFGAIYIRLGLALYAGYYGAGVRAAWLFWWAMFALAVYASMSGNYAIGSQAGFWYGTVMNSLMTLVPGCSEVCREWFYRHANQPSGMIGVHIGLMGGLIGVSSASVVLGRARARAALSQISSSDLRIVVGAIAVCIIALAAVMSIPAAFFNPDIYRAATPFSTPEQIYPDWYLAPWFQMVRIVPSKQMAASIWVAALLVPVLMPAMAFGPRCQAFRQANSVATLVLGVAVVLLAIDARAVWDFQNFIPARLLTAYYFGYFLLIAPVLNLIDALSRRAGG